jgi:hypothetical protein
MWFVIQEMLDIIGILYFSEINLPQNEAVLLLPEVTAFAVCRHKKHKDF